MHMPLENISILDALDPASGTGGNGAWVAAKDHAKFLAILMTGAGAGGDVDFKLQAADNVAGDNPVDITDHALVTIAQASASSKQATIELRQRAIPQGKTHIRMVDAAGGATLLSALLLGYEPFEVIPGVSRNKATVVQTVSVRP